MKSLNEQIDDFIMPFGKFKDCKLEDVDLEYLDWFAINSTNRLHRMIANKYIERVTKKFKNNNVDLDRVINKDDDLEKEMNEHF